MTVSDTCVLEGACLPTLEAPLAADQPTPQPEPETLSYPPQIPSGYLSQSPRDGERYDAYWGVAFLIPDTSYRVAVCREGRQWVLQQRKGQDQWKSRKFFARKEGLDRRLRELLPAETYEAIKGRIEALPI